MRNMTILLAVTLSVPQLASAQLRCNDDEKITACFSRLDKAAHQAEDDEDKKDRPNEITKSVQAKPTGVDIFGDNASSSTKDLLSLLSAAAKSVAQDDKQQELTITSNLPPLLTGMLVQLQGVAHQPQLYSPLKNALTGAGEVTRQESRLNDFSDVSAVLSLSPVNAAIGRYFSQNADEFAALHQVILDATDPALDKRRFAILQKIQFAGFLDPPAREQPELRAMIESYQQDHAAALAQRVDRFQTDKLALFADMVANQPQLIVTGAYRFKSAVAGPNETSAQAAYEYSYYSLNRYRSRIRKCLDNACRLQEFKRYASDSESAIRAGDRLAASVQETWISAYSFALPSDSVSLRQARARRLTASLTYGRSLGNKDGQQTGKLDLKAQYDNYTDDPLQKDRGTITLTYTRKITDAFSLPLGLVYANHGEFIGDVQHRFGVHFGLTYKLFGQNGS